MEMPTNVMVLHTLPQAARSYRSTILNHSADTVWAMIRDFNSYPAYVDGVTESILEDDKAGDEVGAVRCFIYNGARLRQTLTGHSDAERWFTHAGCEPLVWPGSGEVGPVTYENAIHVIPLSDGDRTFVEWWLDYTAETPEDLHEWKKYFDDSLPGWFASLRDHLARAEPPSTDTPSTDTVFVVGLKLKEGVTPEAYERFAREVDKPTCEAELPSITEWRLHRVEPMPAETGPAPFDYVEVVSLTSPQDFAVDLESDTVAELGRGLSELVETTTLLMTTRIL